MLSPRFHAFVESAAGVAAEGGLSWSKAGLIPREPALGGQIGVDHVRILQQAARLDALLLQLGLQALDARLKCSRSAPPSDFSCVSGQERWEHDQARSSVVRNPAKVLDDKWVEPEDYARYQYLLNLPGETSGSYSRNLNHLRGGGVF